MRLTHTWDAWCDVLVAFGRSFALVGALIVSATCLAAPAHAQSKFKVTDGSGVSLDATLSANRGTLTLKGPKGTFVFTYNQEYNTATHFGYGTNKGEIQELRWPKTGRGQLIAYLRSNDERVPSQWRAIGNVQPVAAAKPKPKPTPPKGDAFPKRSWRSHNGAIVHLAIRDDSNWMAAGDANRATRMWNLNTYQAGKTLTGLGGALAFRRGGALAGGWANSVGEWRGGNTTTRLPGVPASVSSLAYRGDGGLLAVGGLLKHPDSSLQFGAIRLWDHQPVRRIKTLYETQRAPVRAMAFTPNHEYLVTASGNTLTRWNLKDYSSTQLTRVQGVIHSLACGGTGSSPRMLIGGTRAGGGFVMSIQGNDIETRNLPLPVYSVAISADGTRYVIPQGNTVLYGRDGRDQPFVLTAPSAVRAVAISPNGAKIAAGGSDGKITVWTVGQPRRPPTVARTPPNFRIQTRILDQQTQKLLPKATITSQGGPGRCNPLEWKPTPASHYFEMLAAGTYQFRVTCPGYKTRDFQLKTGNQELKYDLKMIRDVAPPKPTPKPTPAISPILLLVQHQDGTPVTGAKIQLIAGPGQVTPKGEQPRGTHRFEATKAGEYRFDISKPGYTSQMVAASPDGRPKKITLHRKFTLLLTILDPDQKPVAKPRIVVSGAGKETKLASSGAIHSYSLSAEGVYEVTISKAGFKQQTFNVDVRKQYTAKKITLRYGLELAIAIVDSDFNTIDRPTIAITPPDKAKKLSTKGAVHTYSFKSDGRYQFKVSKEGFVSQTRTLDLSTGEGKTTFKLRAVEYELVVRVPAGGDVTVHAPKRTVVTRRVDASYAMWLSQGVYQVSYTNDDEFTFEKKVTITSGNAELKFEPDPFPEARRFHREMDTNEDGKLTKDDVATRWDQISQAIDENRDGELSIEEIAAQINHVDPTKDEIFTKSPLPARSRSDDLRRKLDSLPGTGSGWAKKDLDPETWKFFEKLDADGNEVIDTNEQKQITDAMEKQAIADTVNDSDATSVPSALLSLKRRLRRLDKNGDGFGRTDVTEDAWLWLFRNYDKNTNDQLDASEELAFQTEFQQVATEHVQGKALIEALRPLFRKRDKDGNGVGDDEVDALSWQVLTKYDTEPRNGRIDRNAEETRFLQDYQAKLIELLKLMVEAGDQPATPPANSKAAHLRATMKQFDTKGDGLDTTDVSADTWSTLFAKYDTNKDGRLDATETDKWVKAWEKWTEEPVDEPDAKDAVKRRVLTVRKIGSR